MLYRSPEDISGLFFLSFPKGDYPSAAFVEVEEITLKFGIKIAGSTGMPILTQGSAEGSFQVEVKCKPKP
ncbi:MAG: CU044_2847 family protein [Cyanobacteria bacterium J06636_28]